VFQNTLNSADCIVSALLETHVREDLTVRGINAFILTRIVTINNVICKVKVRIRVEDSRACLIEGGSVA